MKKYSKMKPSGVEWIGEVPEGWEIKKLKHFAEIKLGKMLTPDDKGGFFLKPYLRAQNLQWFKADLNDVKEMWFSDKEMTTYRVEKDDLLVSEGGEVGRTCIWENEIEEVYIQNSVNKVAIKECGSAKFYLYCFSSCANKGYFEAMVNRVSIAHLTKEKLKEVEFPFPQPVEQPTIAHYLDQKTTQIDQTIAEKEKLVELFREERQAIINHAVTKGIRAGVKMKDSGVAWMGEVPEGWEVKKLKYISEAIQTGKTPPSNEEKFYQNGSVNWFNPSDFMGELVLKNSRRKVSNLAVEEGELKVYKAGTILLIGIGATLGKVGVIEEMGCSNQQINAITIKEGTNHFFVAHFLDSFSGVIAGFSNASTLAIFNQTQTKNFEIVVPPRDEQDQIVNFIDQKTTQIDQAIHGIQQEIALLQEYRQALIFEAVTGKIDVRETT